MISKNTNYIASLDHLRWLAAFLVFLWHSNTNFIPKEFISKYSIINFFLEGHNGVALFFCISGFIFTYIAYGKKINYFQFIKNRFLRVFPLIFVFLIFASLLGKINDDGLIKFFNFLGGGAPFVTWSIIVELQIYFILPVFFNYLLNFNIKKVIIFIFGILIISFSIKFFFYAYKNDFRTISYWSVFGRIDQFIFGCFAGYFYKNIKINITNKYLFILLFLNLFIIIEFYSKFRLFGGYTSIPTKSLIWLFLPYIEGFIWSILIFLWCCIKFDKAFLFLSKFFSYLGSISYSTYMIHVPFIHFYIWLYTNILNFNLSSNSLGLANDFANLIFAIQKSFVFIFSIDTSLSLKQQAVEMGVLFTLFIAYPILLILSSIFNEILEKPFLSLRSKYLDKNNKIT